MSFISPRASRLLSVTESVVLPPRAEEAVQYVQLQQLQYSRVAGATSIAADLFCAGDRRCDIYSVVALLGRPRAVSSGQ
jgi:hypothetical protein